MLSDVNFLHYFLFLGAFTCLVPHVNSLVVSTYNLWNVMFHWEVRKLRIVEMVGLHSRSWILQVQAQPPRARRDKSSKGQGQSQE
jgi:hypothetical protein